MKRTTEQTRNADLARLVCNVFPMLSKWVTRRLNLPGEPKLSASQAQVLLLLEQQDMSITEIAQKLDIARPNATPLVNGLQKLGLVTRSQERKDHRVISVSLTDAGKAHAEAIRDGISACTEEWLSQLSKRDAASLKAGLAVLDKLLNPPGESDSAEKQ